MKNIKFLAEKLRTSHEALGAILEHEFFSNDPDFVDCAKDLRTMRKKLILAEKITEIALPPQ